MAKFKKVIAVIAVMATVATCFAGCGTAKEDTSSSTKTESSVSQEDKKEESQAEEKEESKEEEKPAAEIPSDYELPASPEIVVYQNDKEVFHYNGETTSELKSMLEGMGLKDNGGYKVIEDSQKLTVEVYATNISIDVNRLNDDMRIVVDGKEMETLQSVAVDGHVSTDTSDFKPDDFKTKQYAYLTIVTSSKTGNIVGCDVQINNVPEN